MDEVAVKVIPTYTHYMHTSLKRYIQVVNIFRALISYKIIIKE